LPKLLRFLAFTFVGELLFLLWLRISGADVERRQQRALARDPARARPDQLHEADGPRRPLGREQVCLVCGRRRPQLKRDPLGRASLDA
jgi:hypothetical protein